MGDKIVSTRGPARTRQALVRMTDEEYARLIVDAEFAEMSISEYVRKAIRGHSVGLCIACGGTGRSA